MKIDAHSLLIAGLAIALLCAIQLARPVRQPEHPPTSQRDLRVAPAMPRPQVEPERPAVRRLDPPHSAPAPRSPLADDLNAANGDGRKDVAIVFTLFARYRERFGGFPTGEDNAAFVNALTGNNPLRLAFIDRTHPAINARGELVDRWGKVFVFHLVSRDRIDVRSAGPDGELYTTDDLVKASPGSANL